MFVSVTVKLGLAHFRLSCSLGLGKIEVIMLSSVETPCVASLFVEKHTYETALFLESVQTVGERL